MTEEPRGALRPDPLAGASVHSRVVPCASVRDEVARAVCWLVAQHADGCPWRSMALVVPGKRKWRERVVDAFDAAGVPHRLLIGHPGATPSRFDDDEDRVVALSLYAVDASTFRTVAIVGLGDLPWKQQSLDEARRAVAHAQAAATACRMLTFSKRSPLVDALPID